MTTSITVRDINPGDMARLRRGAGRAGTSVDELVRGLIHKRRVRVERRPTQSEVFEHHFGEKHGVKLPPRVRFGYKPLSFSCDREA